MLYVSYNFIKLGENKQNQEESKEDQKEEHARETGYKRA